MALFDRWAVCRLRDLSLNNSAVPFFRFVSTTELSVHLMTARAREVPRFGKKNGEKQIFF